ncbi:MAG TPA: DNA-binding response regulator [Prolixibacteraceae bacterium]|nr:DNA-binding response regulator [Prolixibacteraceae bacterium]
MPKQILIVEDHPIVSESLLRLFSDSSLNINCVAAANGIKGLAFLNGNSFDLIILDIHLPDISGVEFCKIAKSRFPGIKIVAVTTLAQRHIVEQMLDAGVDGFILKTSDTEDIVNGVLQVLKTGQLYLGKGVKELIKGISVNNSDLPMITRRESEILKLIADGLTNQEIAEKLFISPLTVDTHRKNLLLKFSARNTAILIKTAVSKGYIS